MSEYVKYEKQATIVLCVVLACFLGIVLIAGISDDSSPNSYSSDTSEPTPEPDVPEAPVFNSPWDGSVEQVEDWVERNMIDPDFRKWYPVAQADNGNYFTRVRYSAENAFGGHTIHDEYFFFDPSGNFINRMDTELVQRLTEQ